MNHRTRVDWNYVWLALYHATKPVADQRIDDIENRDSNDMFDIICGGKSRIKFVLKDEIKIVPGMGMFVIRTYPNCYILLSLCSKLRHCSNYFDNYN